MLKDQMFKVGDKVIVVDETCGHEFNIGDIVKITDIEDNGDGETSYQCTKCDDDNEYWYLDKNEIRFVSRCELADIKVGDKVRIINTQNIYGEKFHAFKLGEVVTVDCINHYSIDCVNSDGLEQSIRKEHFELINDEDKPNMLYKVGDKVIVVDEIYGHGFDIGNIVTVMKVDASDPNETYMCEDHNGREWWVGNSEVIPADDTDDNGVKFLSVGTKVEIVSDLSLHNIEIGSKGVIVETDVGCKTNLIYRVDVGTGGQHWVKADEVSEIEEYDITDSILSITSVIDMIRGTTLSIEVFNDATYQLINQDNGSYSTKFNTLDELVNAIRIVKEYNELTKDWT